MQHTKQSLAAHAPYPGFQLHIDIMAVPDESKHLIRPQRYQITAIDIATQIRFLGLCRSLTATSAVRFLRKALSFFAKLGICVQSVRTPNHAMFLKTDLRRGKKVCHLHPFTRFCRKRGIIHVLNRHDLRWHNCFVEQSRQIDEEEFYRFWNPGRLSDKALAAKLQIWQYRYNCFRLHPCCNYEPPLKRYLSLNKAD
ncbi:MAG: hypothetical protein HQL44_08760 [Alphaproteobacteria bacterium]|nr:hypothetical protein [Alphaproteobacteria bacterium]